MFRKGITMIQMRKITSRLRCTDILKWLAIAVVMGALLTYQHHHMQSFLKTDTRKIEIQHPAVATLENLKTESPQNENKATGKAPEKSQTAAASYGNFKMESSKNVNWVKGKSQTAAASFGNLNAESPKSEMLSAGKPHRKPKTKTSQITSVGTFELNRGMEKPTNGTMTSQMKPRQTSDFSILLKTKANKDGVVFLSVLDESYFDLAINLISTSYVPLSITNFLFICESKQAQFKMEDYGVPCILHEVVRDVNKASKFGTKAFIEKTLVKPLYVLKALLLGHKVILIDVDIVLFKNPLDHLNCSTSLYDLCIQSDSAHKNSINSGFYFVNPTKAGIQIHQDIVGILTNNFTVRVQELMRGLMIPKIDEGQLRVLQLNAKTYAPGKTYFEYGKRIFKGDNKCTACILVHNNWILHKPAKVYRMKETGLWEVDIGRYYSDGNRKYLTYDNTLDVGNITVSLERNALKVAMVIGKLLNRTVILPRFSCYGCSFRTCTWTKHKKCSMNVHFFIADFDKYFADKYRESCFLEHHLVPNAVKSNISPVIYINSSATLQEKAKNYSFTLPEKDWVKPDSVEKVFTPSDQQKGASTEEIVNWLKTKDFDKYKVLTFHSLYFAVTQISSKHRGLGLNKIPNKALTGGDYRQNKVRDKFVEMGP